MVKMNAIVIRLIGGGAISQFNKEREISWWGYRNIEILPTVFEDITALLKRNESTRFIFICGGIGAFLFTKLARQLCLIAYQDKVGREIVSTLNGIAIEYLKSQNFDVFPSEVSLEKLAATYTSSSNQCFFVKPNENCISTDTLAAKAALESKACMILYVKKGAPLYHLGFDKPTVMNNWSLDDLGTKSLDLYNHSSKHYVLDHQSCSLLKSLNIKTYIIPPEMVSELIVDDFTKNDLKFFTRLF
jgi:uridylate kinase